MEQVQRKLEIAETGERMGHINIRKPNSTAAMRRKDKGREVRSEWNAVCERALMWKAYNRFVGRRNQDVRVFFKRSPGHDCVVSQHPWESDKEVIEYKVNKVDEAISSRCWPMQAPKVPSTFCMHCRVMPTDDFIWFLMRRLGSKGTSKEGTECCCGHCTTQDSDDIGCCIVLEVEYPRQGKLQVGAGSLDHG